MPTRITIEKTFVNESWVNVYWTNAELASAGTVVSALVNAERPLYPTSVIITKARADDGVEGTDLFVTSVFNMTGSRTDPGQLYPLFATARVDFTIAGQGRPGRKYIRASIAESDTDSFTYLSGYVTLVNTYAAAVVAAGVCDPQGSAFVSGAFYPRPNIRQLTRRGKKKITP